jgi:catechol 2,3-dioxygenase-like lactoylglutathione lyase family enzyme
VIEVERVDFLSIPTQDLPRSRTFYEDVLGLPIDRETPTGIEYTCGQVTLGVWEPEKIGLPFAPNPNDIALRVPDVAAAREALEDQGVEFVGETFDTGVCHMAFFHDPDGNALMLHRRYAPVEK